MHIVTGGAGFIGSNLVAALCARGAEVMVVDRLRQGVKWRNLAKHPVAGGGDLVLPDGTAISIGKLASAHEATLPALMGEK
jgi:nucleoside-diphosphate-sugar epimerase